MEGQGLSLVGGHPRARLVHLRGDVGLTKDVDRALISSRLPYGVEHVADEGGHTGFAEKCPARLVCLQKLVAFDVLPDEFREFISRAFHFF